MCGIAGFFDPSGAQSISVGLLENMTHAMTHRGPDGSGIWRAQGVGLGHRRLAVIDVHDSTQPMHSPDGAATIVFNGEIYNFRTLRAELEALGHRFHTHGDTEVILAAWMQWGEDCLSRLRGMFAFAIHDARDQSLFLARDRLGVKPLYYAELPDGSFIFASEMKGIVGHPHVVRKIDPTAVEDFFAYGYIPDPKTIFSSIRKLEPGHCLHLRRAGDEARPQRYWDFSFTRRHHGSPQDLGDELIARLRESISLRMIADVPLGAFLSGGVDSSAVVALMSGLSDQAVETCSIGFTAADYDESAYATRIAQRYETHHRSHILDAAGGHALLDKLVEGFDEPFADSSALPTYLVCALAREKVTVALSGDGADEALAGYRRYAFHMAEERVRGLLPAGVRRAVFGPLGAIYPKMDWAPRFLRAKTSFQALAQSAGHAYFNSIAVCPDFVRSRLFTDKMRHDLGGYAAHQLYENTIAAAPADDMLGAVQYADMRHWLPGDILTKVDRMSMANSLEAREPFLDHELIEWIGGLPSAMRLQAGQGKWLLKQALEPYVPHDILYRPKMGFVVPMADWFQGVWRSRIDDIMTQSSLLDTGWFDRRNLRGFLTAHRNGLGRHERLLWQLMIFEMTTKRLMSLPVWQI